MEEEGSGVDGSGAWNESKKHPGNEKIRRGKAEISLLPYAMPPSLSNPIRPFLGAGDEPKEEEKLEEWEEIRVRRNRNKQKKDRKRKE
ncbi:hypothetical protein Pmani_025886 [Petrolisthes manimaculis]|uniref:Uncharacterized protein n=1 Tax=Petrolisthes manimaculis TaxID=1843537 RepID=A0AAE1TYF4_9EUCA|nr:hypothetical protein Pmani_025886 [Petrolisthes manimaculis]